MATGTPRKSRKADARVTVVKAANGDPIVANAREIEDDYIAFYQSGDQWGLIKPSYDLRRLEQLVERNNTLAPCIMAMVTNIDGTGYEIERRDGETMEDKDKAAVEPAKNFFDECAPMMSFQTLRKKVRFDIERTGNGYIEIVRDPADQKIVFAGYLESKMIRFGRLSDTVPVQVTMERGGKEITFTQFKRERRYAQLVGQQLVWFAEYGASRDLDKHTGKWFPKNTLPAQQKATEVLHFGLLPDLFTPYGIPRWISQTPSVIGSRDAEEHNLQYFDAGGVPPHLVIVSGGQLAEKTVEAIQKGLNMRDSHARIQVIEAFSTGGDLDSAGKVDVKVEKFGADVTQDPMFAKYDADCADRVRRAFRLPAILIGDSKDYNFATAHASYLVAEAQVFQPEREAFDEVVNSTILPDLLGTRDYIYRSKPISIVDVPTQIEAMAIAEATGICDPDHLITLLGEISGMEFKVIDKKDRMTPDHIQAALDALMLASRGNKMPLPPAKKTTAANQNTPAQSAPAPKRQPVAAVKREYEDGRSEGLTNLLGCMMSVVAAQEGMAEEA